MSTTSDVGIPRTLSAAERALLAINRWTLIAMMGSMACLVFANVIARYLFNDSIIWVEEFTQFEMIWITFLGAGLALREGRHVAVEILEDYLPPGFRRALRMFIGVAILVLLIAMTLLGLQITQFTWNQETPMMGIRTGIPYLGVPIGAALCALHLVLTFREFVDRRFEHTADPAIEAE